MAREDRKLLLPPDAQGLVEIAAALQDVVDLAHGHGARVGRVERSRQRPGERIGGGVRIAVDLAPIVEESEADQARDRRLRRLDPEGLPRRAERGERDRSAPPSRSWTSAACTIACISSPWVSTRTCRFLPLIFLPAS